VPILTIDTTDDLNELRVSFNETATRWNNLGTYDAIVITGGSINGTTIGSSSPSTATFTNLTVNSTLTVSAATLNFADNQISGNKISGGTIDTVVVELSNTTPTIGAHATSKTYVDLQINNTLEKALQYAMIFGE